MRKLAISIACAAVMAAPAMADEMWKTDIGTMVWEDDYDGGAILMVEVGGKPVRFYLEGLTTSIETRGNFTGYWINTDDEQLCSSQMMGPDGTKSRTWGRVSLTFLDPAFPSDWVLLASDCLAEPSIPLTGRASTGE
jgi:hypothetical protein